MPNLAELDPAEMFEQLMVAVRKKEKGFRIPPGVYRFNESFPAFRLSRLEGFTIWADGVVFLFAPRVKQPAVLLGGCRGVRFVGLTIDFDPLPFTQGKVAAIDERNHSVRLTVEEGYPLPDRSWSDAGGGNTKTISFDRDGRMSATRMDWVKALRSIDERNIQIALRGGWLLTEAGRKFDVGDYLALPDRAWRQTFQLLDCADCTIEDITLQASAQMGFIENGGAGGNQYLRCRIDRKAGTTRLLACNADGIHSISVQRGPTLRECFLAHLGDDLVNIHGTLSVVVGKASPDGKSVLCLASRAEDVASGAKLHIADAEFTQLRPATIETVEKVEEEATIAHARKAAEEWKYSPTVYGRFDVFQVTLSHPAEPGSLLSSETSLPDGAVVSDCVLSDSYGRGILLKAKNSSIARNVIRRVGSGGIHVGADRHWCDGPIPHDVKIDGNTIVKTHQQLHPLPQFLAITIGNATEVDIPNDPARAQLALKRIYAEWERKEAAFRKANNITLSDNKIVDCRFDELLKKQ